MRNILFIISCFLFVCVFRVNTLRESNDDKFWESLINEVVKEGGYINPNTTIFNDPLEGMTVIAKEDIPYQQIVMSVPQSITLKNEDIIQEFPSWKNLSILANGAELSLYLAYHANSNNEDVPLYVKYTPNTCVNGLYFEPDVIKMLDSRAHDYFIERLRYLNQEWDTIQNALKNGTIESDQILSSITFSTYKWAACVTYTRSFQREMGINGSVHIPLGDIINHSGKFNTIWYYDNNTSSWIWKTLVDVPKGNPIISSYGQHKENIELLFYYGFSIEDNTNDLGYIKREFEDPIKGVIFSLYKDKFYKDFITYNREGISEKEIEITRLFYLPTYQMTSYHVSKILSGDVVWPLERDMWDLIYRRCFYSMTVDIPGGSEDLDKIQLEEELKNLNTQTSKELKEYWQTRVIALQYRIHRRYFVRSACGWIYQQLKKVGGGYE